MVVQLARVRPFLYTAMRRNPQGFHSGLKNTGAAAGRKVNASLLVSVTKGISPHAALPRPLPVSSTISTPRFPWMGFNMFGQRLRRMATYCERQGCKLRRSLRHGRLTGLLRLCTRLDWHVVQSTRWSAPAWSSSRSSAPTARLLPSRETVGAYRSAIAHSA